MFLGEHIRLDYLRAIKRIDKAQPAYQKLIEEADILKSLNHECIPVIYDLEEDAQYFYIIMEYVEGLSLRDQVETTVPSVRMKLLSSVRKSVRYFNYYIPANTLSYT